MLSAKKNLELTQVSAGTPGGELLRRYWQPFAAASEMKGRWTKRVRLLGEDLVLFRSNKGDLGLIHEYCPHRQVSLAYGFPTEEGIRCPYHGWMFNKDGRCLDQPNEPAGSNAKDKIRTKAYPVQELGGLLFTYMGPDPAPLLPRYDGFILPRAVRMIGKTLVPANWVQIMENSADPIHAEWLHGNLTEAVYERRTGTPFKTSISRHHLKIRFVEKEYGLQKQRLLEGAPEDSSDWTVGHPIVFPTMLYAGTMSDTTQFHKYQIRVPVDDTHTLHMWYNAFIPPPDVNIPAHLLSDVPVHDVPYLDDEGEFDLGCVDAQDIMAWVTQGPIADRTKEQLCSSDVGVGIWRRMLFREMEKVKNGEDPLGLIRDPAKQYVAIPVERKGRAVAESSELWLRTQARYSPVIHEVIKLFEPDYDVIRLSAAE